MRIYRIGDERHPLWDGTGAALLGGRWNSPGRSVIYGSLSYACAMLEILAQANIGRIPRTHRYLIAEVPDGLSIERHDQSSLQSFRQGLFSASQTCNEISMIDEAVF